MKDCMLKCTVEFKENFTKDKLYEVKGNIITNDKGERICVNRLTLKDLNDGGTAKFEFYVLPNTKKIEVTIENGKVIGKLKDENCTNIVNVDYDGDFNKCASSVVNKLINTNSKKRTKGVYCVGIAQRYNFFRFDAVESYTNIIKQKYLVAYDKQEAIDLYSKRFKHDYEFLAKEDEEGNIIPDVRPNFQLESNEVCILGKGRCNNLTIRFLEENLRASDYLEYCAQFK